MVAEAERERSPQPVLREHGEVSPGDVVFSFCDTAIGVVTGGAPTGPKPDFGAAGSNWSREGWFVPFDYCILNNQIRPKDHAAILRPFLPRNTRRSKRAGTVSSPFTSPRFRRPSLTLSSVSSVKPTGTRTRRLPSFKARLIRPASKQRLWTRALPDRRSGSSLSEPGVARVCLGRTFC